MPKKSSVKIDEMQKRINKFISARNWGEKYQVYGILLNLTEEIGEAWNIVKHLEKDETLLKKVMSENKLELEDSIGDLMYLVYKLACVFEVDSQKAVIDRLNEFEERFPADFMKKHTYAGNRRAGGIDYKYQKKQPK
ncbi:hypothetical protein A3K34_02430 [candidate division WWE3 bacterium RIFOXYC1_FULL_40_10]|uniref:NTP pyrophosphohydrolase MazG putative catalytic core domain-containing protein n=1 Tax=candidate division WWE3 bacterium RIFOXYA2_FULL_46_9 TaxID=1802636 RepID=A0A1F4W2S5_UNCKA|nr:MAG: hypothetical protein A3K58_02430 [candidate division WWE3 bacterium RIFOXYB1_FULL_40_22]OGC61707.1 MAG: hypothetical protein A3K37_02430 [candidate division WWE3 bacterium RIFOXYA1_FULL_40_11]OGC63691.1 MAG: hypothetical protein A2264_04920 [candidate division WWE3 bacterium RIFOXYA2_FULL_46_9]OGC64881.1 MAG: hypothetical protein A2326_01255 [candidate division WWE3 bacterium RIFOXYB2_FULL_41_6]OGC66090.1 MAG: hypothetical protein A3K34_02430 [candidate division WWE3 bacterium RIFOXYC1_